MKTTKKSFRLFCDSLKVLDEMTKDQIADLFLAIRDYNVTEKTELTWLMWAVFVWFKNQFDRDNDEYKKVCKARADAWKLGGTANAKFAKQKLAKASKRKQSLAKQADKDTDTDTETETETDTNTTNTNTTGIAQTIKSENEMFFDKIQNDMDWLIQEMNMQEHYEDAKLELFKFWNYWTEKDMRGREKWKWEKTFEVKRRLTTWLLNKKFTFNQPKHGKRFSD